MVDLSEPPLIRGGLYIILVLVTLGFLFPRPAHEAFDNCYYPPARITWKDDAIKAPLIVVSKEFAPKVKHIKKIGVGNGSCVPYARHKTGIQLFGTARTFLDQAPKAGYATSTIPAKGGIVVTNESRAGHVAVVEEVTARAIRVSEQNYDGLYIISSRLIEINDPIIKGYISK